MTKLHDNGTALPAFINGHAKEFCSATGRILDFMFALSCFLLSSACFNQREAKPCLDVEGIWYNNTCYNVTTLEPGRTEELKNLTKNLVASSQEYFV